MRILIAPDKFKGTLSAGEVADIIASRLDPLDAEIIKIPMADGGEGTAECLAQIFDMVPNVLPGTNSIMEALPAGATYYVNRTARTVAVDSSTVLGLSLINPKASSPIGRTSFPLGRLINDIIKTEQPETIYVGVGGTSTVDGGEGFLEALGFDYSSRITKVKLPKIVALLDVECPLVAPDGFPSSLTFAPQKGATTSDMEKIRRHLLLLEARLPELKGSKTTGAGGGLAFALAAVGATFALGALFIIRHSKISDLNLDYIITGEGSLDGQTRLGKVVYWLINYGKGRDIPVIAVGGRVMPDFDVEGASKIISTQHYPPEGCLNYHKAKARLAAASDSIAKWIAGRQ
ncbi:MAG: glycerate kinase [Duncaniella sp.]|nr:glycerate kinase [Muribaculum sp.]MCM1255006.1 glycerate kinase [Duncaniella sp.]